jgi:hypothetical protein
MSMSIYVITKLQVSKNILSMRVDEFIPQLCNTESASSTMGIPYSRQINAALSQVTPLVAEGFKVLETTKNISILLATIQVLTVIFLFLILGVLIALLIAVNPDLEHERRTLVTPVLRWFTRWITEQDSRRYLGVAVFVVVFGAFAGAGGGFYVMRKSEMEALTRAELEEKAEGDAADDQEQEG